MSIHYESLPTIKHASTLSLGHYKLPELVHREDPASEIMLDFQHITPTMLSQHSSLDSAIEIVKSTHHDVLLVINQEQHLVGLISAHYLLSSAPMQYINSHQLQRQQVCIDVLMTPLNQILQIDQQELQQAQVGHIIQTLCAANKHYALVIQHDDEQTPTLKGIFSLSIINKHMREDISIESWTKEMRSIAQMKHDDVG